MPGSSKPIVFNGIDGSTGKYSTPPMTIERLASVARQSFAPPGEKQGRWYDRVRKAGAGFFAPMSQLNPLDLKDVGWGIICPHDCDPAVIEALEPLIEHRRQAAGPLYRSFLKGEGYRPGETILEFLARHGHAPSSGPVDPELMPYYLLLVGGPDKIPFSFQYQLDVSYAVGRLSLEKPDDYAIYARSVVEAETLGVSRARAMRFFGVKNDDDEATQSSASLLVDPLYQSTNKWNGDKALGWSIERTLADEATKAKMLAALTDPGGPAFLFTASHGMGYPSGDTKQKAFQGALLCQDWPGPVSWDGAIPERFLLAGSDIASDADVHGLISFHFACYGAGTPDYDDYVINPENGRPRIAESPFLGALPTRLLSHPRGSALACVGHIERAWTFSFTSGEGDKSIVPFRDAMNQILRGVPIGHAMEALNSRFAGVAANFTSVLEEDRYRDADNKIDPETIALKWIEHNDARSYVILGDPFVSLKPERLGQPARKRPSGPVVVSKPAGTEPAKPKPPKKATGKLESDGGAAPKKPKKPASKPKKAARPKPEDKASSSFAPAKSKSTGYTEVTNFAFVDPESGRRVTVTSGQGKVDPAYPYQAAWEHVSMATRLLGAHEIVMSSVETDAEGRSVLKASYKVGEGEETLREHFGVVRDKSGQCLQVQLVALPEDSSAQEFLSEILNGAVPADARPAVRVASAGENDGSREDRPERVGLYAVKLPKAFRLQGTRRFLSADGRRTVEVDFGDSAGSSAVKPFALPEIGPRSQFGKVESVPRFLRSPIRYEASTFQPVAKSPGATAFSKTAGGPKPDSNQPVLSRKVEIEGRKAVVRVYGEDADPEAARAATDDVLASLG